MEQLVSELKKIIPFKDTVEIGDIVLIVAKEPQMLVYALVSEIVRDPVKRDEWWHLTMHILALPPRTVTWTLRTAQMSGQEIFTMDGEPRFMKAIALDLPKRQGKEPDSRKGRDAGPLRRIK